jgi:hypothetical protein
MLNDFVSVIKETNFNFFVNFLMSSYTFISLLVEILALLIFSAFLTLLAGMRQIFNQGQNNFLTII